MCTILTVCLCIMDACMLSVCLPVCLVVYINFCLPVGLPACLAVSLSARQYGRLYALLGQVHSKVLRCNLLRTYVRHTSRGDISINFKRSTSYDRKQTATVGKNTYKVPQLLFRTRQNRPNS